MAPAMPNDMRLAMMAPSKIGWNTARWWSFFQPRVQRAENVQPDAGDDEAHGEAGETGCESPREGGDEKKRKSDAIHGCLLPTKE